VVERRGAQGAVRERVVRMAPNEGAAISMRAMVLSGLLSSWEVKPRSAAELKEGAALFERTEALFDAPMWASGPAPNFVALDYCENKNEARFLLAISLPLSTSSPLVDTGTCTCEYTCHVSTLYQ